MYYNYCWIQMFGIAAQFVGNPEIIKDYVFPGLIFGYLTHLEYMELQDNRKGRLKSQGRGRRRP